MRKEGTGSRTLVSLLHSDILTAGVSSEETLGLSSEEPKLNQTEQVLIGSRG